MTQTIITVKTASGEALRVRVGDELPEGVGKIEGRETGFVALARPGLAWPTARQAAVFAEDFDFMAAAAAR